MAVAARLSALRSLAVGTEPVLAVTFDRVIPGQLPAPAFFQRRIPRLWRWWQKSLGHAPKSFESAKVPGSWLKFIQILYMMTGKEVCWMSSGKIRDSWLTEHIEATSCAKHWPFGSADPAWSASMRWTAAGGYERRRLPGSKLHHKKYHTISSISQVFFSHRLLGGFFPNILGG